MKTQFLKSITFTCIVGIALILLNSTQTNAQAGTSIRVKIPFGYTIGNKNLPEGKYDIKKISDGLFRIWSEDGKHSMLTHIVCPVSSRRNTVAKLVFNRYGDQYFLSQIWLNAETGVQLYKSKTERSAEANMRLAKKDAKPQTVEVIALVE